MDFITPKNIWEKKKWKGIEPSTVAAHLLMFDEYGREHTQCAVIKFLAKFN